MATRTAVPSRGRRRREYRCTTCRCRSSRGCVPIRRRSVCSKSTSPIRSGHLHSSHPCRKWPTRGDNPMRASQKVARLIAEPAAEFYTEVLDELNRSGIPFLIGGTFALSYYVGWNRPTKDVDVFVREEDVPRVLNHFSAAGFETELAHPHWLAKIRRGEWFA